MEDTKLSQVSASICVSLILFFGVVGGVIKDVDCLCMALALVAEAQEPRLFFMPSTPNRKPRWTSHTSHTGNDGFVFV